MTERTLVQTTLNPDISVSTGLLQCKSANCGQRSLKISNHTDCQKRQLNLQRRATSRDKPSQVPQIVHEVLQSPGQPLDANTRVEMESHFNRDFSQVRVHTDAKAAESATAVNALAYTVGQDIMFRSQQYAPESNSGQQLLAHELVHVLQQEDSNTVSNLELAISDNASLEAEADQASQAIAGGQQIQLSLASAATAIQRQIADSRREEIIRLGESEDPANRQRALELIIETYYERPDTLARIEYDPDFNYESPQDAETGFAPLRQPQTIKIGSRFFNRFRERFDQRARTIGHELQHVVQRAPVSQQQSGGRTVGSTLLGIGVGILGGAALGGIGLGVAAAAGASLSPLAIGLGLAGGAVLGGVIGGIADPFSSRTTEQSQEPIQNSHTREFLALYWTVTANVSGLRPLSRGQTLQNIRQPNVGALDEYRQMPPDDQRRYREQYEHIQRILRELENEERVRKGDTRAKTE
ncbi:hypothetical protein DSM106972_059460 [Dulcicalothrix desertica PCC 7102]|uniref:eCIS core domain-containing protein n=1 Tax=Dulcicalothrix desertica PCC 7102 TaxID=232991 RepID=A0A3S1AK07_9CYAN|nr:DUF4157 domain-containing protein [Dulcicalothrix desertica]RUT02468.1 hypothetical protein DSM106972_059460 [Dulcicalothrix desertica PCC 7102]TWH55315.1 uncharacterized protein DUF4157 [Dulcicalothrix desertica PCC 7102]